MLKNPMQLAEEARREIPEVEVPEVRANLDAGSLPYLLIDVREPQEHAQGIVPGAIPIPRGVLELQIPRLTQNENQPVVCYCGHGIRSLFAAQQLKKMGFTNVKSMAGGFAAWAQGGNPVEAP